MATKVMENAALWSPALYVTDDAPRIQAMAHQG
jgi:hypothetical protein